MLPQKNRISRKDFPAHKAQGFPNQQVRALGVKLFSPLFTAVFYKGEGESRVSVVVSKKTSKTAVSRNSMRRRFYELLAPFLKGLTSPSTIVVYPKKEAEKARFSVLKSEVEKTLKQAKLVN